MEYISIIISILASIISGMVLFFLKHYFEKKEKLEKGKEQSKQKENILILKSINAIGKLTYANSIAIRDGKKNGELKSAISEYNDIKKICMNIF